MRLVCARPHPRYGAPRDEGTLAFETVGAWLFHQVLHTRRLRERLIRIGFIDTVCEGGLLFWRWDYQNASEAEWIRNFEHQQWEKKRDQARARWGEAAG